LQYRVYVKKGLVRTKLFHLICSTYKLSDEIALENLIIGTSTSF